MPALTCSVNTTANVDNQLNVYFNTTTNTLALQLQSARSDSGDVVQAWESGTTDQPGFIVNPSQLANVNYLGTNLVLGITKKNPPEGQVETQNDVSVLAPVYKPISATDLGNTSIAACYSSDTAWVYYLVGTDANSLQIKETVVANGASQVYNDTNSILPQSSLAAYFSPKKRTRMIIYQARSKSLLWEYNVESGDTPISNSTDADDRTSLAVVYNDEKAFLYYTSKGVLRRIAKTSPDGWGSSADVSGAPNVAEDSQITVVQANKYNHVFYMADNGASNTFVHILDQY